MDFDQLQDNLAQMERRCKASWDHLKVIAKHEMKPALKQKMSDFLKDCAERIIILKIVHRRIINRLVLIGSLAGTGSHFWLLTFVYTIKTLFWGTFFLASAGFMPSCCFWAIQCMQCVRSAFIALARSSVNLPWSIAPRGSACYSRNRRGPTTERGTRPGEK